MSEQSADNGRPTEQGSYEPPEFLRYRSFLALNVLPVSQQFIPSAFADLERLMELLDVALSWAYDSPPEHWFPNNMAAVALLTRAYQGLQAASHLCALAFYIEARATLRGVYEAAGLARTRHIAPTLPSDGCTMVSGLKTTSPGSSSQTVSGSQKYLILRCTDGSASLPTPRPSAHWVTCSLVTLSTGLRAIPSRIVRNWRSALSSSPRLRCLLHGLFVTLRQA